MSCSRCGGYHPGMDCIMHEAMVANRFDGGTVFRGGGNSHFTFDHGTAHETTEVPGLKQGEPVSIHTFIPKNGF